MVINPNSEYFFCARMRLAGYLQQHGYTIVGNAPNKYDCTRVVWLFDNTPELRQAVQAYFAERYGA